MKKAIVSILLFVAFFGTIIGGSFLLTPKQSVQPESSIQFDQVVVVTIDPQKILQLKKQGIPEAAIICAPTTIDVFTKNALITAAKNRGLDIKVGGIGDICRDDTNRLYRNIIVELPVGCDTFEAIQQLILIDFISFVGNDEHQATKTGCMVEIK